jgi:hypothetical protein
MLSELKLAWVPAFAGMTSLGETCEEHDFEGLAVVHAEHGYAMTRSMAAPRRRDDLIGWILGAQ